MSRNPIDDAWRHKVAAGHLQKITDPWPSNKAHSREILAALSQGAAEGRRYWQLKQSGACPTTLRAAELCLFGFTLDDVPDDRTLDFHATRGGKWQR